MEKLAYSWKNVSCCKIIKTILYKPSKTKEDSQRPYDLLVNPFLVAPMYEFNPDIFLIFTKPPESVYKLQVSMQETKTNCKWVILPESNKHKRQQELAATCSRQASSVLKMLSDVLTFFAVVLREPSNFKAPLITQWNAPPAAAQFLCLPLSGLDSSHKQKRTLKICHVIHFIFDSQLLHIRWMPSVKEIEYSTYSNNFSPLYWLNLNNNTYNKKIPIQMLVRCTSNQYWSRISFWRDKV